MTHRDLAAKIAAADPADLLPSDRDVITEHGKRCTLLASTDLGHGARIVVVRDSHGRTFTAPVVEGDVLRRAAVGDGASAALVRALADDRPLGPGFSLTTWYSESCEGETAIPVDQTNESVIVGDRAVVKWSVETPPGPHPAPHRIATLAEHGFAGMPRPWGTLQWSPGPDWPPRLIATVVEYLPGVRDGWDWAVDDLRTALTTGSDGPVLEAARRLGRLAAELHLGLASAEPSTMTAVRAEEWAVAAVAELDDAIAGTGGVEGERLAARSAELRARLGALASAAGTPVVAVHGDLHVGQILRTADGARYAVTDFDGNPVLSASERFRPQPAAVDVAGMLQSLENAGHVVARRTEGVHAADVTRLTSRACGEFLDSYRATTKAHDSSWLLDDALIIPLRISQICREYLYAAQHLRRWLYVPDAALHALDRLED